MLLKQTITILKPKTLALMLVCNTVLINLSLAEEKLPSVIEAGNSRIDASAEVQKKINHVAAKTTNVQESIFETRKMLDGLIAYNDLLSLQVSQQNSAIIDLKESIKNVSVLERQIIPLMMRMIDTLSIFIKNDLPFLTDERSTRLGGLREMMRRSDVSTAEKFRRLIEAYEIETDYGRTIEAYSGTLVLNGLAREVDFLKIGRVALLAQTTNMKLSLYWNSVTKTWSTINERAQKIEIRNGIKIALKEISPNLITIPIKTPLDIAHE